MVQSKSILALANENNINLKKILSHLAIGKETLAKHVTHNIEKLLLPVLRELRSNATTIEVKYLNLLESNLKDLAGKFGTTLSECQYLTPKETQICNMIKNGLNTKGIAAFLNVSVLTINTHRTSIRKKLKISNQKINLITHLQLI